MFNWFKKKQAPAIAKENTKIEKKESLADYNKLIQSTIKPYIKIDAKPESDLPPWQSKFGGTPYMPEGVVWPQMSDGSDLHLLAQINFGEVPALDPFPQKGILQFWLGVNDLYGLDFLILSDKTLFGLFITQTWKNWLTELLWGQIEVG